jgi:hypothetical protein
VTVFDFAPLSEKRIRFIEEQYHSTMLRRIKDSLEILFGLANVLADNLTEINSIEIKPELIREHFSCHCLSRAA